MLQSMGSQRVGHDRATEQQQDYQESIKIGALASTLAHLKSILHRLTRVIFYAKIISCSPYHHLFFTGFLVSFRVKLKLRAQALCDLGKSTKIILSPHH